ncbi:variant erythrocyte surface antigen-1, beta subunit [Babesia caballi]|uniref:Variant erythrocyte surface antigen-1, beta subunit n=1 Tax=Babesia caballi TaxID=5871 RepID=A0AAV4LPF4_BABCB|nr:variant erythrocyte surface antigen-1, beta subunit [Babesia caballi]
MGGDDLLKKPPENLKDAIDWILWFGAYGRTTSSGMSNYTKLANVLNTLQEFKDAKEKALGGIEPEGAINMLAKGLAGFLGYVSQGDYNFSDSGVIQHGKGYTSKYKDATWDGSDNNGEMARIFLCAAAITFLGLSFLCWKCKHTQGGWNGESLTGSDVNSGLGQFMRDMGYQSKYFDGVKKGTDVASLLEENEKGFDGLVQPATKNFYDDFIQALETQYKPASNALNSPLTACYKFAKEYFTSQFKKPKGEVTDQTLTSIKDALQGFKSSCQNSAQDLSDQIGNFIKIAMTSPSSVLSNRKNNTDTPSPAGPVAGTLSTLGLGGGAAAVYILDLGGTKTLVNGFLRIG